MVCARGGSWCAHRASIPSVSCRQLPKSKNKDNKEDDGDDASDLLITNKPRMSGQGSVTTKTIPPKEPTDTTTSSSFDNKSSEINRWLPSKRSTRSQKTNIDVSYDEGKDQESKDDERNPRFSVSDRGEESDADIDCQSNCLVSEITSKTPARFNRLVDSPNKKKQFKCNFKGCTRIYKRLDNFNKHLAKHRRGFDAKPFICDCKGCDRRFGSRFALKAHLYQHSNKYKCKIEGCNRSFSRAIYLRDHLAKHRHGFEAKLFTCDFNGCDRRFGSRSGLRDHINKHTNKYKCTIEGCNRSFTRSTFLSDHLAQHQLGFDAKLFTCDFNGCGRQFSNRSSLFNHKALHRGKYECEKCGKKCRSMYSLKEHQRTLHTGEKPYKCKVDGCDRSYSTVSGLCKHSAEHSDKYKCSDCGKRCQSKMGLEDHRRSHDRDLQWKCDVDECGRRFKSRKGFDIHKARHTDKIEEKLFKCQVEGCGKRFKTDFGLILHNNEHEGKFFRRYRSDKLKQNENSIDKKKLGKLKSVEKKQTLAKKSKSKTETAKRSPIKQRLSKQRAIENMRNQFNDETGSEWDDDSSGFSTNLSPENSLADDNEIVLDQNDISTVESSPRLETKSVNFQVNLDNADAIDKANCLVIQKCLKYNSKIYPIKQFKCNLNGCDRIFATLFQLHRHKRRHQGRCRCEECWKRWKLKFNWNKHRRF